MRTQCTTTAPFPALDFELGYCLGLLVGEGSFIMYRGRAKCIDVKLAARDPEPLVFLHQRFGGDLYGPYHSQGRDYMVWRLRRKEEVERLLPLLVDHLPHSRKRQQFLAWVAEWIRWQLREDGDWEETRPYAHLKEATAE